MSSYSFTPRAFRDLEEIHDFVAEDSPKAALRLVNVLEKKCETLARSPGMGRSREELAPRLRSFPVGKYVIFYRRIDKEIEIIRVRGRMLRPFLKIGGGLGQDQVTYIDPIDRKNRAIVACRLQTLRRAN